MALLDSELQAEKFYLSGTLNLIETDIAQYKDKLTELANEMDETIKYVWDNIHSMDSAEKSFFNQSLQMSNNIGSSNNIRYQVLLKMIDSPYHARIDFTFENGETESIYIGIANLSDNYGNNVIFDWRAPISSMFYDYELGPASYMAPSGPIDGKIVLKRQYKIKNKQLIYAFDCTTNITDDILQQALSESSGDKMKNIVVTVQKEQNPIIRYIGNKHLIVEGPAGSGKTSLLQHRNAHLLYVYKDQLNPEEILIFSPNSMFSDYISGVLPSLGERNVPCTEFSEYAENILFEYKSIENYSSFIERINNIVDSSLQEHIKVKLSHEFIEIIDRFITNFIKNYDVPEIVVSSNFSLSKLQSEEMFKEQYQNLPFFSRAKKLLSYAAMKYSHNTVGKINKQKLEDNLQSKYFLLDTKDILIEFFNSPKVQETIKKLFPNLDVETFFQNILEVINSKRLTFEDATFLLYFEGKLKGFGIDKRMKYVIIDEGQDYSYMQYIILKNIFTNAKFSILGDSNQTLNPYFKYDSLNDLSSVFDGQTEFLPLSTSYRNSLEITNFCNDILDLNNVNPINRHSYEPEVFIDENAESRIKALINILKNNLALGYNRNAIIVNRKKEVETLRNILIENGIPNTDEIFILPVYYAKGLEFDSVIVYNEGIKMDKHLLYVACTRALHKLDIVSDFQVIKKKGVTKT